ncbi:hypothetical protein [Streptomyces cyaneofuscatus]
MNVPDPADENYFDVMAVADLLEKLTSLQLTPGWTATAQSS